MVKLSVCTVTYNHEKFIAQAIESVLMQQIDFELEMIIGEDCSTDGTRAIVQAYAAKYPHIIKPIFYETNVGAGRNSVTCLSACTGEYIAALEGDDYWTDPHKLQKQVDILDNDRSLSLCFHDAEMIDERDYTDENKTFRILFNEKATAGRQIYSDLYSTALSRSNRVFTQEDVIIHGWFMPTASLVFRRAAFKMPEWYSGDKALHLVLTNYGNALYLPEIMSVYRMHNGGLSNNKKTLKSIDRRMKQTDSFKSIVNEKYIPLFDRHYQDVYFDFSLYHRRHGNRLVGWGYYIKAITINKEIFLESLGRLLKKLPV